MADYYGDITLGDTIDIKFTTEDGSGAPITLAGSPVVSAYIGNIATQITAGVTLSVDHDSVTGFHNVRVVASAGNGFAAGTNIALLMTGGTVGGTPVTQILGAFSIENRSAATLDASDVADAVLDALSADHNDAGTIGEKINNGGGGLVEGIDY